MLRCLGKLPARLPHGLVSLRSVLPAGFIGGKSTNWRAHMPVNGVDMLGNDSCGNCVFCTRFHYLQLAELYVNGVDIAPTAVECIAAYSDATGYDPTDPTTDKGTYVQGPSGAVDYWVNKGVLIGDKRYFLKDGVFLDTLDVEHLKLALSLGPVFCGATVRRDDVLSSFLWDSGNSPIDGGHEFLVVDCETLASGKTYFDVVTWDGEWRFTDDWMLAQMDEAMMPLDANFFNASGLDPADVDMAAVSASMQILKA